MSETSYIVGTTTEGLYDEKVDGGIYSINDRQSHTIGTFWKRADGGHQFINAFLDWRKQEGEHRWSVYLFDRSKPFGGLIRFCKTCKYIDCPHFFPPADDKSYEIQHTPYAGQRWSVQTCSICKRRIRTSGCGYSQPSRAGVELIARVATSLGRNAPGFNSSYGSGWFIELPACISQVIDTQGEAEAERLVRAAFAAGDSSIVTRPMMGY